MMGTPTRRRGVGVCDNNKTKTTNTATNRVQTESKHEQQFDNVVGSSPLPSTPSTSWWSSSTSANIVDENRNPRPNPIIRMTMPSLLESECIRQRARRLICEVFRGHMRQQLYLMEHIVKPMKSVKLLNDTVLYQSIDKLKSLCDLYAKLVKLLSASIDKTTTATNGMNNDNHRFESYLTEIFDGKYSNQLIRVFRDYCHSTIYSAQWIDQLNLVSNDERMKSIINNETADQRSVLEMFEKIGQQLNEYPPLIDQLLQETPLQTVSYQRIDRALIGSRTIAKSVSANDVDECRLNVKKRTKRNVLHNIRHYFNNMIKRNNRT